MQSQQTQYSKSNTNNTRYWLAAVIVLILASVTLASFLIMQNQGYIKLKAITAKELSEADVQLRKRQEEIDLSKEQQEADRAEYRVSLTELKKQVSEAQAQTAKQVELTEKSEELQKLNTDSAEILSTLMRSTFKRLYHEQKKDPTFSAVKLLDYTSGQLKSAARRKSPLAVAKIRSHFAWTYYNSVKNYEGSQKQATLASDSFKKLLGDDHLDTIDSLQLLANALHQQGKYELAVNAFNEALAGARKQFGKDHKKTLQVLEELVPPLEGLKKYDDLVVVLQETLRIKKIMSSSRRGYLHFTMLHLGMALLETDRYEEAEALFRELLANRLKYSTPDRRTSFEPKVYLTWTLRQQNKLEEAERLHKELTSLADFMNAINKQFADQHYGRYLTYLGKFKEAEHYLLRNFNSYSKPNSPPKSVEMNPAIDALIQLYEAWDKPEEAEKMREQLITPDLNAG